MDTRPAVSHDSSEVALVRCDSYDPAKADAAVARALALLGGMERFVSPDDRVLVKPNLLAPRGPDKTVTTHPAVFEAVLKPLKGRCASLVYGDSPGFGRPELVARMAGLTEPAKRQGVPLGEFTTGRPVPFPAGRVCRQFDLAQAAIDATAIVSVCKMKTHQLTTITGAVKNQLGCVHGLNKASFHTRFPDPDSFSKMLVDLDLLLKPRLFVMDGVVAMEGNGPNSGDPVKMGVILASADPVALDATFCRMVNIEPAEVPTCRWGQEHGLGFHDAARIRLLGDPLEGFVNRAFRVERRKAFAGVDILSTIPRTLLTKKPVIDARLCVRCGICIEACPVEGKALRFGPKGRKAPPVYDYGKCVRCFCCQEMCPRRAIKPRQSLVGRLLMKI